MSAQVEFSKGDTVRLKSGGPLMTVQVCSQNLVYCVWFDDEATRKEGSFESRTLEKAEPQEPGANA